MGPAELAWSERPSIGINRRTETTAFLANRQDRFLCVFGLARVITSINTLLSPAFARLNPPSMYATTPLFSIQIKVSNRTSGVGSLFSFANGFLEFLLQQIGGVFLGFDGLTEDGIAAAVALLHGTGGFFHIVIRFRLDGSSVRDDRLGFRVDLH